MKKTVIEDLWEAKKILLLRCLVAFSLIATAVVVGYMSHHYLSQSQHELQDSHYRSVVNKLEQATQLSINDKLRATASTTNLLQFSFPNASAWPYCVLPMSFYESSVRPLIDMSEARAMATAVVITRDMVPSFENFAYDYFADNGHPELGLSPFGKGIFSINYSDPAQPRFHDTTGHALGKYQILLPVIMSGMLARNSKAFLHNVYSDLNRINTVDIILTCVESVTNGDYSNCVAVTGMLYLVSDYPNYRPANLVMRPVVVQGKPVGITYTIYNWDTLLTRGVSETVKGIYAIVHRGDQYYSFYYTGLGVTYLGSGDRHDSKYDAQRHSFALAQFANTDLYYVDLYPSDTWMEQYYSDAPLIFCAVTVSVVAFTSLVFFTYDYFVNRKVREKEIVLSTKRQFVRFISHEIRTPMNIVHLGLKVLYAEIYQLLKPNARLQKPALVNETSNDIKEEDQKRAQEWLGLVSDIEESVDNAIAVLNDLINYDKLDLGKMTLDLELIDPWRLISSSVKPFKVQARHGNIELTLTMEVDNQLISEEAHEELRLLRLYGDRMKLSQVIRNLLSNALKFTPSGGRVSIQGKCRRSYLFAHCFANYM